MAAHATVACMESLGDRVRRLRTELGLSQQQLARKAGVSQITISDVERGRNSGRRSMLALARRVFPQAIAETAGWRAARDLG
jgi:transcriptional regulator with XRE-family HTH domain